MGGQTASCPQKTEGVAGRKDLSGWLDTEDTLSAQDPALTEPPKGVLRYSLLDNRHLISLRIMGHHDMPAFKGPLLSGKHTVLLVSG